MNAGMICGILLIAISVGSASAQIEDRLAINVGVPSATATRFCNNSGARLFYNALDDAQPLIDSIADLQGSATETIWRRNYERWEDKYFDPVPPDLNCLPALVNLIVVDWLITERYIERYIDDFGEVQAERLLPLIHQMARLDLPALNAGTAEPEALVLNQPYLQMPHCSIQQAQTFYDTIEGYVEQVERLDLVNDRQSFRRWADAFQSWLDSHWSPYHEQPCGWTLFMIIFGAYAGYTDGFNLAEGREDSSQRSIFGVILYTYWDVDAAILELAQAYDLTAAADAPAEQPHVLNAAANLYTTFRAPDVPIIQALVDAYLNREGDSYDG